MRSVPQGEEYTVERFGPVRSVRAEPGHGLVLEVAFDSIHKSSRHKSGVAMRFPRISRIRSPAPGSWTLETEKGEEFSGMCPSFAFMDENTMVTLSDAPAADTLALAEGGVN